MTEERFELLEELGRGGMGVVWKARDRTNGEIVALKVLHEQFAQDPAFVARLEREVDVTSRIDSPFVVKMLGYGQLGSRPYACMECVPGESLRDVLRRVGTISWEETMRVLRQIGAGLQAAHRVGIVHRDVKPSNVIVAPRGVAKLVDFGIAKAADMTALTGASTTMGTAAYTAPDGESTPAADLYALGCTAFEMLSGEPPFQGDTPAHVLIKHLRDDPDLTQIPAESREIVGWLLKKDPKVRLSSAERLLSVLGADSKFTPATVSDSLQQSDDELDTMFPESIAGRRLASAFVDYVSIFAVGQIVSSATHGSVKYSLASGVLWLLIAFLWEASSGQSPGKLIFRLRVVDEDDQPIAELRALSRTTLKFASVVLIVPAIVEFIMIIATHGEQRLADKWTGTYVVRSSDVSPETA